MRAFQIRRKNKKPITLKTEWVAVAFKDPVRNRPVKELVIYVGEPPTIMPSTLGWEHGDS